VMRGLAGKGVLITGAAGGIGAATARRFADEGCRVFLTDLDADAVAALAAELGDAAGCTACDLRDAAAIAAMVAEAAAWLDGIDVLANNAGVASRDAFLDVPLERFDAILAVNLRAAFAVAQAVARHMVERGGGAIVNMSSTNGLAGEEDYAPYNASKAGVLLLTKTMAVELGGRGVRVNAVCPGFVRTPLNEAIARDLGGERFIEGYARDRIPMGRVCDPAEVAAVYAFLASEDASFVHGAAVVVDGGQTAAM
jgi:NAD(P)-dependent dehydrogenase (short-subunit alcohol dehydrogenase family)